MYIKWFSFCEWQTVVYDEQQYDLYKWTALKKVPKRRHEKIQASIELKAWLPVWCCYWAKKQPVESEDNFSGWNKLLFHFFMGNKEGGSFHLLSCINLLMCSSPILCPSCLLFLMVARYDERSDVWSLGCIVLELATCGFLDVSNWMLKMWSMASKLMKVYQGIFMLVIHMQVQGYFLF